MGFLKKDKKRGNITAEKPAPRKEPFEKITGFLKIGTVACITAAVVGISANALVSDGERIPYGSGRTTVSGNFSSSPQSSSNSAEFAETAQTDIVFPININTADLEELQMLSGIGETKARAITAYREAYGDFTSVDDLLNVSGIGEKILDKIRDYITVGDYIEDSAEPSAPVSSAGSSSAGTESSAPVEISYPININTASVDELRALSGIGEVKARAIVEYREEYGRFTSVDELVNVYGIGEKILDKIRDYITVGDYAPNIPEQSEHNSSAESSAPAEVSYPININTASAEELQLLSGIGEVKARAIIEYREKHGGFTSVNELVNVYGIGEKTLDKIRDYITVGFYAPNIPEQSAPNSSAESSAPVEVSYPININTASAEELELLSGIGEVKARAIIAYREEHGGFTSVEELVNVYGIGEKTLGKIRGYITV